MNQWIVVSACCLLLAGCSANAGSTTVTTTEPISKQQSVDSGAAVEQGQNIEEAYSLALDTLLSLDHEWDKNMAYISVEVNHAHGIVEDDDLPAILENLKKKKNAAVYHFNFSELEDRGLANEEGLLAGVLLQIDEATIAENDKLTVKGSVTKSAKQSVGATIELQQSEGEWEVTKTKITTEC